MIAGVLLAAGSGSRFGGGKLLARLADGTPVAVRAARALRAAVDRALAVVRPGDSELGALLEAEGFEVLSFAGAADGMGASLAFGVSAAPGADGWLVALADMPWVRPETAIAVSDLLRRGALIAAPAFRGRRGHPVGFGCSLISELEGLRGDRGAREILVRHVDQITFLELDDESILLDIDELTDMTAGGKGVAKNFSV